MHSTIDVFQVGKHAAHGTQTNPVGSYQNNVISMKNCGSGCWIYYYVLFAFVYLFGLNTIDFFAESFGNTSVADQGLTGPTAGFFSLLCLVVVVVIFFAKGLARYPVFGVGLLALVVNVSLLSTFAVGSFIAFLVEQDSTPGTCIDTVAEIVMLTNFACYPLLLVCGLVASGKTQFKM